MKAQVASEVKHANQKQELKKQYLVFVYHLAIKYIFNLKYRYVKLYESWTADLMAGNNLLFYGCGSKISLIEQYAYLY